jgi:hypothetical protein
MQRRILLSGLLAALALAAACTDETPTFTGEEGFPPGATPVTREVIFPASEFFRTLGTYAGYTRASDLPAVVVANQFDEGLNAHALARFGPFPTQVSYRREGVERRDAAFSYTTSTLLMRVDTSASTPGPVTVRVWRAEQEWERTSATWTTAVDTGAVRRPWTTPGGTRGALLAEATFAGDSAAGDTLVLALTGSAVGSLADSLTSEGVVITTSTPGARLEVFEMILRVGIRPDSAAPDTVILQNLGSAADRTTIYTPEPPTQPGVISVGGVLSARTLIELRPDQPVPNCAAGQTCGTVPLRDVLLNEVSLLLRPVNVPNGFDPLTTVPLSLRVVDEVELGRTAPLGPRVLGDNLNPTQVYGFNEGDSIVALPISFLARNLALADTLPRTFALVSELVGFTQPPTFGVAQFDAEPRLRIIYTLPARRRLP